MNTPPPRILAHLLAMATMFTVITSIGLATGESDASAIPLGQLGPRAGKDLRGGGLSLTPAEPGAELRCDFQNLRGLASRNGLWLESAAPETAGVPFRVVARGFGRDTLQVLAATGEIEVARSLARWIRPGMVEEYSVSVDGVRQDFLIPAKPAGSGPLRVDLAVDGATAEATPAGANLIIDGSGRQLAYQRLQVTDTAGQTFAARIDVISTNRLELVVDDTHAAYPLRIDPTFSDADWVSLNPGIPGAISQVNAAVVDAAGNLYIGGSFTFVGTVAASRIAKWNGSAWSALGSGMNNTVSALAVDDAGNLYAGGSFTAAGETSANRVAKWNGSAWSELGTGMDATVRALAVDNGGHLFAGGDFTSADGEPANRVARWNGSTWSVLGSGTSSTVHALALDGSGNLYAGGGFTQAGGNPALRIAKWDGSAWSALGTGMDQNVNALAVDGADQLYAGGDFTSAGGLSASHIAKWNGSAWLTLGTGMNQTVSALAVDGAGQLYAGGNFTTAGGGAALRIAKWNGSAWSALGSGMERDVSALAVDGAGHLHAGGVFITAGGNSALRIAKWNGSAWSAFGTGMNGSVAALAMDGSGNLYVGGSFTTAGGVPARRIAKWNGSVWSALGTGMDNTVNALAVDDSGNLYAGGTFSTAGGVVASCIAKWNGSNWSPLGIGVSSSAASSVNALALDGEGNLYAGGAFTLAGLVSASRIAKWNGSAWSPLGAGTNNTVFALAVDGSDDLYAGGQFTTAAGTTVNRIAKWNGSVWSALGSGVGGTVLALAVDDSQNLFAGGSFTTAGGSSASRIAKWNGSAWSALGSGVDSPVAALATDAASHLLVGGAFTFAGTSVTSPFITRANLTASAADIAIAQAGPLTDGVSGVAFGTVNAGGGSVVKTFTISNTGSAGLADLAVTKDGPHAADFAVSGLSATSLAVGAGTVTFSVTFSPLAGASSRTAAIHIASNVTNTRNPFDITLTGAANHAPTQVALSATTLVENVPANTTVGTLSSTDFDAGDTFSYALVAGSGSNDNSAFTLVGTALKINISPVSAVKNSYAVRIRSTDSGGLLFESPLSITITAGAIAFADWASDSGLSGADAAHGAKPFNDGIENLLKYAFNMKGAGPDTSSLTESGDAGLPQIELRGAGGQRVLQVEFVRRKGSSLTYNAEYSNTLGDFVAMTGTPTVTPINTQWERVRVEQPAPTTSVLSIFARVKVSSP
ncbi:hypothetical protein HQ447_08530 [bacterium]|nr:hypothetical protein [bacterium]